VAGSVVGVRTRGNTRRPDLAAAEPRPPAVGKDFVSALEEKSRAIRDPVEKLRYIRGSLARYQEADRRLQAVRFSPLRKLLYRLSPLHGLRHLLTNNPWGATPEATPRPARRSKVPALATAFLATIAGVSATGYHFSHPAAAAPVLPPTPAPLPVAENLPPLPAGVSPAAIWMVEKGEGWEQYSNGLRIDTSFAVAGDPRRFHVFDRAGGMQEAVNTTPVGILFHTSESDIWPLDEAHNESLRTSSHGLLKYLQRNRVYNYLIDRFGRVFRVVEETDKANHAGMAVWSQGDNLFLSLNNAFLGVCFETRWEGGRALPITQAQLAAGRNLTDYLRGRWSVAPDMCVGHGLASVNPKKHLIGHHLDWARGFPFEAFGLPNQYLRPAPSVAVFGFQYDEQFLGVMGEPWAGVREAEQTLLAEATTKGQTMEELRRGRQGLFDRWLAEQTKDQEASSASNGPGGQSTPGEGRRPARATPARGRATNHVSGG
jgi:hypothetical protein